ncbi:MAG: hypothetical protein IGR93_08100 [Hydrococcus sp. C42_A2020_068]|nr:hypothetical protein [Hydrococcus sp. C42_A2020_068]
MGAASRYWRLARLDATGRRKVEEIASAKAFFQQQFPELATQVDVADSIIQRQLLALRRDAAKAPLGEDTNPLNAERCLRCFISGQIEQVCIQLEVQFGSEHGFTRHDLFPFVLDDILDDLRSSSSPRAYKSLAIEILQTFDPERASLSTWTTRLVKHHRELNAFLLERGVYLVSDWAILNDTAPKQLQRILAGFHNLAPAQIQHACLLLESYHAIYRRDRLKQRSSGVKGKCLPPSREQLQQIAHLLSQTANLTLLPENTMSRLQDLAERLRQYRIYARGGSAAQESLDRPKTRLIAERLQAFAPTNDSEEENEQAEFLTFYRQQFISCLERAIEQVTQTRFSRLQLKDPQMARQFLTALELFHCQGQSMGEIAPVVGLQAQYQVSRLLKLKEFRADIRQQMLKDLRDRTLETAMTYTHPDRLQKVEAALDEQIAATIEEAETEASIAKNRSSSSLFAQRLCRHLEARRNSP